MGGLCTLSSGSHTPQRHHSPPSRSFIPQRLCTHTFQPGSRGCSREPHRPSTDPQDLTVWGRGQSVTNCLHTNKDYKAQRAGALRVKSKGMQPPLKGSLSKKDGEARKVPQFPHLQNWPDALAPPSHGASEGPVARAGGKRDFVNCRVPPAECVCIPPAPHRNSPIQPISDHVTAQLIIYLKRWIHSGNSALGKVSLLLGHQQLVSVTCLFSGMN